MNATPTGSLCRDAAQLGVVVLYVLSTCGHFEPEG